jgi:hypothetical protein
VNKDKNPNVNTRGVFSFKLPPYKVASHENILIPVGTAIIIVAAVTKAYGIGLENKNFKYVKVIKKKTNYYNIITHYIIFFLILKFYTNTFTI